jgi:acyl-CoA synthetase (AMP-forming)/AMP-acid ligase II
VPTPAFPGAATLADVLAQVADAQPGRPALLGEETPVTFGALDRAVDALAAQLAGLAGPGARCAVLMENAPEHVVTWFAVLRAGLVLVPVNATLASPEVAHQLADAGAEVVVVSPSLRDRLARWEVGPGCSVVTVRPWRRAAQGPDPSVGPPGGARSLDLDLDQLGPGRPDRAVARSDPAVVWYTSGTTGHPKGALHTHDSCLEAVAAWIAEWDWTPEDRGLIRNLYHVGMMATVVPLLLAGAALAFAGPFSIEGYLASAARHRVTILRTFPVMLALMDRRWDDLAAIDLSSVRRIGVGGSGMARDVLERCIERFSDRVWDYSWSQSELNSGGTNVAGRAWLERLGSCGRPIGCVEALSIQDPDGAELAPGLVGEVCVRSRSAMVGYLGAPEATAEVWRDGWLRTGDLGHLDDRGYLYLVGRQRDVIIRGGENVYPAEIEAVLVAHPGVEDCVAVGIPDSVMVEVPVAFVVLVPGVEVAPAELEALAAENLARYKRPVRIEVVDALPRNPLGKVQRASLVERGRQFAR